MKNPFAQRGAPITFIPPGYNADLDNLPEQSSGGCWAMLRWIALGIVVLAGIFWFVAWIISSRNPAPAPQNYEEPITLIPQMSSATPTLTATPTNTIDPWSATGTALVYQPPTATADYCWFLTPSPTPTPVIFITPDAWSATGTAVWRRENPPTPIVSPTATTPRSWCDYETATPTFTPFILDRSNPTPSATPTAMQTRTPYPIEPQPQTGGIGQPVPPTQIPPVVIPTNIPPTFAPPTIAPTKKPKKTRTPTATFTATMTPTFTETPTPTPTVTPSATNVPVWNVILANCTAGYPTVIVQAVGNFPTPLQWQLLWMPPEGTPPVAALGEWTIEEITAPNAGLAVAQSWAGIAGTYWLMVDESPIVSVICLPSVTITLTPIPVTPETTIEPIPTETPEGTS